MGGGGEGIYAARLFLLFSFPCSADHERGWQSVFFGLATNTLNVMMVINISSVQYNGGFLPDIVLLTPGYYHVVALYL